MPPELPPMDYDGWHFPRPTLAQAYLTQLTGGLQEPLALFSPRRTGKTEFMLRDMAPAAREAGMCVVYADLWQDKAAPLDALLYALTGARDDLAVPSTRVGKLAATPLRRVGALGVSAEFGELPARKVPDSASLKLDALLHEIRERADAPVLLIVDEVQQLAEAPDGERMIAALRSTITQMKGELFVIFTGSSRERLGRLFNLARAPMYEFAQVANFQLLGRDFVHFIAERHRLVRNLPQGQGLDTDALEAAFAALERQPKALIRMVVGMAAELSMDVPAALAKSVALRDRERDYAGQWAGFSALQRLVLARIAGGGEGGLYAAEALAAYAKALGLPKVNAGSVKHAVDELRDAEILRQMGRGELRFESEAFAEWIRARPEV